MEPDDIRRLNAKAIANMAKSREKLAEQLEMEGVNYLNQLVNGHGSFGRKSAKRFEDKLGLDQGWMERPHPGLWKSIGDEFDSTKYIDDMLLGLSPDELLKVVESASSKINKSISKISILPNNVVNPDNE